MRRIYLSVLIAGILIVLAAVPLKAQVSFGLSFNLNSQPAWGPTGYDYAQYYYLPDIEVYYNVSLRRYYYYNRGRWTYSSSLPSRYRNYDLYNSYKVVVNERNPWRNHNSYRDKYASYKGQKNQQPIRDSRDSKYYSNRYHPEYKNWQRQQHQIKGNQNRMEQQNNGNRGNNGNNGKNKDNNGRNNGKK